MGGRASKQKGNRGERHIVNLLRKAGMVANRLPLSGAVRGEHGGCDVTVMMFDRKHRLEVKHHARGFRTLYRWLANEGDPVDMLVVRCDRAEPLVVMPLQALIELAKKPQT